MKLGARRQSRRQGVASYLAHRGRPSKSAWTRLQGRKSEARAQIVRGIGRCGSMARKCNSNRLVSRNAEWYRSAMKRIREFDGLRFFAIAGVLLHHYRPPFRPALDFLSIGWVGVELFFVISGFLITTILVSLRGTKNPYGVFYWRRALRIFPPYYLVLSLVCAVQLIRNVHSPLGVTVGGFFLLTSLKLPIVFHAILSVWHGVQLDSKWIPLSNSFYKNWGDGFNIFWSLSIEELFYLIWAPIVLVCSRRQVQAVSLFAIVFCPLLRVLCHTSSFPEYFIFFCRFDTLMLGSLLSLIFIATSRGEIRRSALNRGLYLVAIASLLCLVLLLVHDGFLNHMELRSTLSFAALGYTLLGFFFASVVGICATHAGAAFWWARALRAWPLVQIGTVSYMMYLIHISVWVACYKLLFRLEARAATPGLMLGCLSAGITVALAALSWRFFEKPILRLKNTSFWERSVTKSKISVQ